MKYTEPDKWQSALPVDRVTELLICDVPLLNSDEKVIVRLLRLYKPWQSFCEEKQVRALGRALVLVKGSPMIPMFNQTKSQNNATVIELLLQGESIALVGHPGIGKSTEVNTLLPRIFAELADSTKPLQHVFQRLGCVLYHYSVKDERINCWIEEGAGLSVSSLNEFFRKFKSSKLVAEGKLPRNDVIMLLELAEHEVDPLFTHIPTVVALSARQVTETLKSFDKAGVLSYITRPPHTEEELLVLATALYHDDSSKFVNTLGLPVNTKLDQVLKEVKERMRCIGPLAREVLDCKNYYKWLRTMQDGKNVQRFLDLDDTISVFDLPGTAKYYVAPLPDGSLQVLGECSKELMLRHAKEQNIATMNQIGLTWQLVEKVVLEYFVLNKGGIHEGATVPYAWRHRHWEFFKNPFPKRRLGRGDTVSADTRAMLIADATKHDRISYFHKSMPKVDIASLDSKCALVSLLHTMPVGEYLTVCQNRSEATFYQMSTLDPSNHPITLAALKKWIRALKLKSVKILFFTNWCQKTTRGFGVDNCTSDDAVSLELFGQFGQFKSFIVRCGVYQSMPQVMLAGDIPTWQDLVHMYSDLQNEEDKVSIILLSIISTIL